MDKNLGVASFYNIFAFDTINLKNADCGGRIAVGNSLKLKNYSIGTTIFPIPKKGKDPSIVVGSNDINIIGGVNFSGNIIKTGTVMNKISMVKNNGMILNGYPINFDYEKDYLRSLSNMMRSTIINTNTNLKNNTLELIGIDSNINIFNINIFNINISNYIKTINIISKEEATIIINVQNKEINFTFDIFLNGEVVKVDDCKRIIWNFNANEINLISNKFYGSILAIDSNIKSTYCEVFGNIICNSIEGSIEAYDFLFEGDLKNLKILNEKLGNEEVLNESIDDLSKIYEKPIDDNINYKNIKEENLNAFSNIVIDDKYDYDSHNEERVNYFGYNDDDDYIDVEYYDKESEESSNIDENVKYDYDSHNEERINYFGQNYDKYEYVDEEDKSYNTDSLKIENNNCDECKKSVIKQRMSLVKEYDSITNLLKSQSNYSKTINNEVKKINEIIDINESITDLLKKVINLEMILLNEIKDLK